MGVVDGTINQQISQARRNNQTNTTTATTTTIPTTTIPTTTIPTTTTKTNDQQQKKRVARHTAAATNLDLLPLLVVFVDKPVDKVGNVTLDVA